MVAKPKPKPASTRGNREAVISVVLEGQTPKAKSVKFWTETEGLPFDNLYVKKSALEKLGNPETLKVTIEPGE